MPVSPPCFSLLPSLLAGLLCAAGDGPGSDAELPLLEVTADDTLVTESCRIRVPPGLVLADRAGDGVLRVLAPGLRLVFEPGSVLAGAEPGSSGDGLTGTAIAIHGQADVTVEGAVLSGYRLGIHASNAPGLTLSRISVLSGFRQRLASTAEAADDGRDWLSPHDNDQGQWAARYGAGLLVQASSGLTVHDCSVRQAQNGLMLDRVTDSSVFDNDFSFLSGWGLSLWRSDRNVISRNSLDFCIRGYSHGVYNRGQDSAGLLMFEQCRDNLISDNSITHGGDGVFAFSGQEALGAHGRLPGGHAGLGHAGNRFELNDLSFAAAHGLELTFAGANEIVGNSFEANAICGLWGGYSRNLIVANNSFIKNGQAGYGSERGGVNIEHGAANRISMNRFEGDACGVRLWWDQDEQLAALPWVLENGADCHGNRVESNEFVDTPVAVELSHCSDTVLEGNVYPGAGSELRVTGQAPERQREHTHAPAAGTGADHEHGDEGPHHHGLPRTEPPVPVPARRPGQVPLGRSRPVDGRPSLRGRDQIVMTEWGPWDHLSPAWRWLSRRPSRHELQALALPDSAAVELHGPGLTLIRDGNTLTIAPQSGAQGLLPYRLTAQGLEPRQDQLLVARWSVTCFALSSDPREDEAGYRAASLSADAVTVELPELRLPFGNGGPSQLALSPELTAAQLPRDGFGTRARLTLPLPAGRYRLSTVSDDGLRVRVDGALVIDDWTWHAPRSQSVDLERKHTGELELQVEHFELDGWAVLELTLEPLP